MIASETSFEPDLSCICMDLRHAPEAQSPFWRCVEVDPLMASALRWKVKDVNVEKAICLDHRIFIQAIIDKHQKNLDEEEKPRYRLPPELDDQLSTATPQFILRNIPKIERYYDLDRALHFDEGEHPLKEAEALWQYSRETRFECSDFSTLETLESIQDFRTFLEEIFYLCPWDEITRTAPSEDSPWHIKYSHTKLAQELLERQHKLTIYSDKGSTTIDTKAFVPRFEPSQERPREAPKGLAPL